MTMPRALPLDIVARIEHDFGTGALTGVADVLAPLLASDRAGEHERLVRSVLVLAAGDLAKLRHYVAQAVMDYRDVIYWAEYDGTGRIADYGQPFID